MATSTKPKNQPVLSPQDTLILLDRAEQLITSGWKQGALAVDADNRSCQPWDERAVKWCELGAMMAASHYIDQELAPDKEDDGPAYRYLVSVFNAANTNILAASHHVGSAVPTINDAYNTSHEQVIKMFQKAKNWISKHGAAN